jgi:ABC-type nitrate/sulfonate/bicarbonate transport system substrate-binding protein
LCLIAHTEINYENRGGSMNFRSLTVGAVAAALTALALTWLPAWVAKEKEFFAKHGLDVTLTVAQNLSVLPGTVGRQFEFVPSTAPDLPKAVASGPNGLHN